MTKFITLLTLAAIAWAQPTPPANTVYASSVSYHVPDESRAAYEAWWKDKGRKMSEALMQENPDITSIVITRVIFGGVNAPAANYYHTTFSKAVPKSTAAANERISQKLFGKSYNEVMKEVFPLRKRLGQTLARQWANAPGAPAAEGDIIRVDRKKVHAGRMGDYLQMEQQHQPLRVAQVAAGKMKSWSGWAMVLPAGSDREFDGYTSLIAKDLESSLNWNQGGSAMAAKLDPPLNYSGLSARAADTSKTTYGETRLVVAVIRRP